MGVSQTPTLKNSVKSQKGQPRYLGCFSCSGANAPLHLWCDGAYMFFTHTCVCATETARPPRARAGSLVSPSKPTKFPLPYIYTGKKGANPRNGTGTRPAPDTHCPTKRAISYADFLLPQAIDNATTQPINVQPRNTFTTMTLPLFGIDL